MPQNPNNQISDPWALKPWAQEKLDEMAARAEQERLEKEAWEKLPPDMRPMASDVMLTGETIPEMPALVAPHPTVDQAPTVTPDSPTIITQAVRPNR